MGIVLFDTKKRISKHEMTPKVWRLKNGYKMSKKARTMLGIKDDTANMLAIGTDDGKVCIMAVGDTEPNNARVSRIDMITNTRAVMEMEKYSQSFLITEDKTDEGYFIMEAQTEEDENTDTEITGEFIKGQTPDDVLTESLTENSEEIIEGEGNKW